MMKKRVDVLLVERGLAESRTQAQALVMAGLVPGYDKPGTQVDESVELTVKGKQPYVSRGGEKLAHGLDRLGVDPAGLDCLDIGASTAAAPTADRLESGDVFDARWGISP
jgi:23S rRNA (cytidine1920-2'-O)/16S rRNA (cytidine1409-2'-O)-methyltransferase